MPQRKPHERAETQRSRNRCLRKIWQTCHAKLWFQSSYAVRTRAVNVYDFSSFGTDCSYSELSHRSHTVLQQSYCSIESTVHCPSILPVPRLAYLLILITPDFCRCRQTSPAEQRYKDRYRPIRHQCASNMLCALQAILQLRRSSSILVIATFPETSFFRRKLGKMRMYVVCSAEVSRAAVQTLLETIT